MRCRDERRDLRRGAVLLAVGVWLLAGTLGVNGLAPGPSWPLLLILIGVALALTPSHRRGRRSGLLLIGWGALAWIATHGIWGLGWKSVGPLILVTLGMLLIWSAIAEQRNGERRTTAGDDDA